jgi:ATP-binding cassette subfamily B multidrug efflux pump
MAAPRLGLLWSYLRPHRRQVLIGVVALVVVNLLSVAIPLIPAWWSSASAARWR